MMVDMVHDKGDPIYHDLSGQKAEDAIMHRAQTWVAKQDDDVQYLFCEHGRYVGYGKVFAYKCERCVPGYEA